MVNSPSFRAVAIMSTSREYEKPVSSRLWRQRPSMIPIVGKLMTPANPTSRTCARKRRMLRIGSVPLTPAITGTSRTTGRISRSATPTRS